MGKTTKRVPLSSSILTTPHLIPWASWSQFILSFTLLTLAVPAYGESPLALMDHGEPLAEIAPHLRSTGVKTPIIEVKWDTQGKILATGDFLGNVSIWDAPSGRELFRLKNSSNKVTSIAFSPNHKHLAVAGQDDILKIWDLENREVIRQQRGTQVAYSPDGSRIASGSRDGQVLISDALHGEEYTTIRAHSGPVTALAWKPDGTMLATSSLASKIAIWDTDGISITLLEDHQHQINNLSWGGPLGFLASASSDRTVMVWNTNDFTRMQTLEGHSSPVLDVAWHPTVEALVSSAEDSTMRIWSLLSGSPTLTKSYGTEVVSSLAFNGNGTLLAAGSRKGNADLWDFSAMYPLRRLQRPTHAVIGLAMSQEPQVLAEVTKGSHVRVWDLEQDQPSHPITFSLGCDECFKSLAIDPKGRALLVGTDRGSVDAWKRKIGSVDTSKRDLKGGDFYKVSSTSIGKGAISALAFGPKAERIAIANENTRQIHLARFPELETQGTIDNGHRGRVETLAFNALGDRLISGARDRTIALWDTANQSMMARSQPLSAAVLSVDFTRDGRIIAALEDDRIVYWANNQDTTLYELPRQTWSTVSVLGAENRMAISRPLSGEIQLFQWDDLDLDRPVRTLLGGVNDQFGSSRHFWVDCQGTTDRCYRHDDGTFLLRKNELDEFEPIAPTSEPSQTDVEIVDGPTRLSIYEGKPTPFQIRVKNNGLQKLFWVRLEQTRPTPDFQVVFYPPPPVPTLAPGDSIDLKCQVSARMSFYDPKNLIEALDLQISTADTHEALASHRIEIHALAPSLSLVKASLNLSHTQLTIETEQETDHSAAPTHLGLDSEGKNIADLELVETGSTDEGQKTFIADIPEGIRSQITGPIDFTLYDTSKHPPYAWRFLEKRVFDPKPWLISSLILVLALLAFIVISALRRRTEQDPAKSLASWAGQQEHMHLAIVIIDVVDSTGLIQGIGSIAWRRVRSGLERRARTLVSQNDGFLIKSTGDGHLIVFKIIRNALQFASRMMEEPGHEAIQLKAAIHFGQVDVGDRDIHGAEVNKTFRVIDRASAKKIWVTDATHNNYQASEDEESYKYHWVEHPEQELKGFQGVYKLWAIGIKENRAILGGFSLFQDSTEAFLEEVGRQLEPKLFQEGDQIFSDNEIGEDIYFIVEGEVALKKKDQVLLVRGPQEYVGEMALIDNAPRSASAFAKTDVSLLKWDGQDFRSALLTNGRVALSMCQALSTKIRESTEVLVEQNVDAQRGAEVQRAMLPPDSYSSDFFEIEVSCQQYSGVGGDYYDYVDLGSGSCLVIIADAQGHGFSAALMVAMLKTQFFSQLVHGHSPEKIMEALNRAVSRYVNITQMVTCFIALIDRTNQELTYAGGGHPPQLLVSPSTDSVSLLESENMILGFDTEVPYRSSKKKWSSGDLLVLFTDGILEATNEDEKEFGLDRTNMFLKEHSQQTPRKIIQDLNQELEAFRRGKDAIDDQTLMIISLK